MLMHRVTFPMPAWVSLDAAGVLTDGDAKTGGKYPKYQCTDSFFFLIPPSFFKMKRR